MCSSDLGPPKQSLRQGLWGSSREGGEANGWRGAELVPAVSVTLDPRATLRVTVQRAPGGHPPVGGVLALCLSRPGLRVSLVSIDSPAPLWAAH